MSASECGQIAGAANTTSLQRIRFPVSELRSIHPWQQLLSGCQQS